MIGPFLTVSEPSTLFISCSKTRRSHFFKLQKENYMQVSVILCGLVLLHAFYAIKDFKFRLKSYTKWPSCLHRSKYPGDIRCTLMRIFIKILEWIYVYIKQMHIEDCLIVCLIIAQLSVSHIQHSIARFYTFSYFAVNTCGYSLFPTKRSFYLINIHI